MKWNYIFCEACDATFEELYAHTADLGAIMADKIIYHSVHFVASATDK